MPARAPAIRSEKPLTPKQRRFVEALLANGGNKTEAAKAAGYGERSAHVTGCRLTKLPWVKRALREALDDILADAAPIAAMTLRQLLDSKSHYVRLEAAKDILDRQGVGTDKKQQDQRPLVLKFNFGSSSASSAPVDVTPEGEAIDGR
jgi:phage terminase small subunit